MTVRHIAIDEIFPYENNTKFHTERQINSVANSIKKFGVTQPIVIDANNVIIIGHCRYEAAKRLGMKEFPCVTAILTEQEAKALRIADNKLNESFWDYDKRNDELSELIEKFDMEELGFSEYDLLSLDDDLLPDSVWLDDIDEYEENANNQLQSTRLLLTYRTKEEADWIEAKLKMGKKIVAYAKDLME